jgi:hypothetical protein
LLDQDGKAYVAEDALTIGDELQDREVPWSGTLEEANATLFKFKSFTFAYTGTEQFYSSGNSRISLPAGAYALKVTKGIEYSVQTQDVRIQAGETVELTVMLSRWINMPREEWYSADDHIHISRPFKELDPLISKWMQAEDLHVANILQWGNSKRFHNTMQYSHGPAGIYQEGDYILSPGQENPRTHFLGHAIILGAQRPINFPDWYLVYKLFFDEARKQGALSGFGHRGRDFEHGLELAHGLMNFMEVVDYYEHKNDLYRFWYDCLNAGFRLTPTAGTDWTGGWSWSSPNSVPGSTRFYTQVEGRLTYPAWLKGVRSGRTFLTNGPILEFRVDGKGVGEELSLKSPGRVVVEGRVRFDPARDAVERLEVIQNGEVIQSFPRAREAAEIHCKLQHEVKEASWLALRSTGTRPGEQTAWLPPIGEPRPSLAHSAPIYVSLKHSPEMGAHPRAKALARMWLERLKALENRLADDELAARAGTNIIDADYFRKNRPALINAIQEAKEYFTDRAGSGCETE